MLHKLRVLAIDGLVPGSQVLQLLSQLLIILSLCR